MKTKQVETAEAIPALAGEALAGARPPDAMALDDILARAASLDGLPLADVAALLLAEGQEADARILDAAGRVKEAVFGPRVVFFAPLYLSNVCSNDCLYCGFRHSNRGAVRRTLGVDEAVSEAARLALTGFRRLLLVAGEHAVHGGVDYLCRVAEAVYARTDIRILHVNSAPVDVDGFRRLKAAGYGVYQCFQETYHRPTYDAMHPSGRKADYLHRLTAMDRALDAGFGDVGLGALLGLYDYRYDALAAVAHSRHLEARYGAAAHTISVPRLTRAPGSGLDGAPRPVGDAEFLRIVAVYRLAVPYAGVVVSTREPAHIREAALGSGASQLSAGSSTEPGGYSDGGRSQAQFTTADTRGLAEMMAVVAGKGLLPSLCTACYRSGRQGEGFHDAAASGAIRELCTPNAVLSLAEYAASCADGALKALLMDTVDKYLAGLDAPVRRDVEAKLALIEKGARDIHY